MGAHPDDLKRRQQAKALLKGEPVVDERKAVKAAILAKNQRNLKNSLHSHGRVKVVVVRRGAKVALVIGEGHGPDALELAEGGKTYQLQVTDKTIEAPQSLMMPGFAEAMKKISPLKIEYK